MRKVNKSILRRILAVFIALMFIITPMTNVVYATEKPTFSDVSAGSSFYEFVETLHKEGVIKGIGGGHPFILSINL